jgi:hypothetical protein
LREGGEKGRGNKIIKLTTLFTNKSKNALRHFIERLHSIDVFHNTSQHKTMWITEF